MATAGGGPPRSLCVVGAGAAGVGAADALRDAAVEVTLLEKSRGVGGRMATRRRAGCRYDHGANYLKDDADGRTADLLAELGTEGLVDVGAPVRPFDADGQIGDPDRPGGHRWSYEAGLTQFAKRVLDRAAPDLHKETRVERLGRTEEGWTATTPGGERYGPFDGLLLTPPAAQTADLLAGADWEDDRRDRLAAAADAVPYRTVLSYALHYPFRAERPYYALINTDREHAVGWVSREECKPGHVPAGESLLIAQMSPAWSLEHYDDDHDEAALAAADLVADLTGDDRLREPDWTDHQRWRYALPDAGLDADPTAAEDAGLFLAGDWVVGAARAHEAFWNGVAAGERVAERL